ncbi:MAG: inorganic diphosphatase [Nitrospina sp.]|jgi:inorganic pyrophosphatase|nr:inorganic diphosphatase [Nitrospina sp.]MBT3510910.1 inorganic diphosphatase [Nitrospina sp.]MBT3875205.1 inorganic diphosphatase [Nitrospina sp.]MBT4048270.1 inorganic diphosphatase [Nitrospina sp.]MBT4557040.1 inorganic diphosphatase [Nitrospina sp.]
MNYLVTIFSIFIFFPNHSGADSCNLPCGIAPGFNFTDPYTLSSGNNLLKDWPPKDESGNINAVIEIPAGRTEKWEVDKAEGNLKWDFKKGRPRVLKYIGYPGNYGMVPQTLLSKESGGDGDPLDIILLGPPIDRGEVATAKLIGVLKLEDDGEQDDKLIAIQFNSPLKKADSIEELDERFPGISRIMELWFTNYKGNGEMESKGFGDLEEAEKILNKASMQYQKSLSNK